MMDVEVQKQVSQLRNVAQTMGDTALEAIGRGDIGLARTAARQAAQYARVAMQLETGDKQFEMGEAQEEAGAPGGLTEERINV